MPAISSVFSSFISSPSLTCSCPVSYLTLPSPSHSAVLSFTSHSSTLNPTLSLLQFLLTHPLSLCSGAAQPVGSSRAPAALHRARSGAQRQLPGSLVCGHPPAPWREGTDTPTHTCSQTLAIWREESWVERPRERKSMQMAWFTSTCSFSVSENRNIVSDILYIYIYIYIYIVC